MDGAGRPAGGAVHACCSNAVAHIVHSGPCWPRPAQDCGCPVGCGQSLWYGLCLPPPPGQLRGVSCSHVQAGRARCAGLLGFRQQRSGRMRHCWSAGAAWLVSGCQAVSMAVWPCRRALPAVPCSMCTGEATVAVRLREGLWPAAALATQDMQAVQLAIAC